MSHLQQYLPMGSKEAKSGKGNAIFRIYSNGIKTHRDPWMYNSSKKELSKNMKKHIDSCNTQDPKNPKIDSLQAKWSRDLSKALVRLTFKPTFNRQLIRTSMYRPFFNQYIYFDKTFIDVAYKIPLFFPKAQSENLVICVPHQFTGSFSAFITNITPDLQVIFNGQYFALYTYNNGSRCDNITDYALKNIRHITTMARFPR